MSQEYTPERLEMDAALIADCGLPYGSYKDEVAAVYRAYAANLRQAARGPQFASADELAHWLESLHECDSNGSVGNRKWEAAQVAARAVRGMGSQAARVDEGQVEARAWMHWRVDEETGERDYDIYSFKSDECADCFPVLIVREAALSAQPAERQGEVLIEAVGRVERDMTGELGINWLVEGGIDALMEGSVLLCSEHDYLTDGDGSATLYTHPAAPVGVPDGWREDVQRAIDRARVFDDGSDGADAESARSVVGILYGLLAAAPSAPQGVE